jgi:hypothetical protein
MRVSSIDSSVVTSTAGAMPIELEQSAHTGRAIATALMVTPMVGLAVSLAAVMAATIIADPQPLAQILDKPTAVLGLVSGLAVTIGLVLHPLASALARIGRRQRASVSATAVAVTERTPFGSRSWTEPLATYIGVAHHLRTSLSGVRHEIVLVHRNPARTVLLLDSHRVLQSELDRMAQLLRLPIIPASSIYWAPAAVKTKAVEQPTYQPLAA